MKRLSEGLGFELKYGAQLPPLKKGRITYKHIVRWCAAQENWDKVHYNQDYVRQKSKLPDVFINCALKQQFVAQFLSRSFGGRGWVWRLDSDFNEVDFAEQTLEVHGQISEISQVPDYLLVNVNYQIYNCDKHEGTTSGKGMVLFSSKEEYITEVHKAKLPEEFKVHTALQKGDSSVPENIVNLIGQTTERVESHYPVSLSRLRLMAEAVMDVHPWHYDPNAAKQSPFGTVVALPLFPLHGIERLPGIRRFSEDPDSIGREASNDVGRLDPSSLGLNPAGMMTGGSRVEIHSLARVGERICAESALAGAEYRADHPTGPSLLVETLNRYWEAGGRPLITERQTSIYRLIPR
jgi:acyl dehydratase